jgi:patatin-like phospholipase/acyl hydrolase
MVAYQMEHVPRVLSLDGGGVRGLSSLVILREIMESIRIKARLPQTPKPCEYFDLIGGTSMGGLVAIMLGLLGMVADIPLSRLISSLSKNA